MKNIRHTADGKTYVRVGVVHTRRSDGTKYIKYHWTYIG